MKPQKIYVGGTSKLFIDEKSIETVIPEFYSNFPTTHFQLTSIDNADFLVLFNHKSDLYSRFIKNGGKKANTILIRMEPYAVYPAQYKERITRKYGLVITAGNSEISNKKFVNVNWPYRYHRNPATPSNTDPDLLNVINSKTDKIENIYEDWNKREIKIVMIAANKVSPTSNSNYSLRRKFAKQLPHETLKVYGPLWNSSLWSKARHRIAVFYAAVRQGSFPNLFEIYGNFWRFYANALGEIEDKHEVLTKSKFALVIENTNDVITEKLFDALVNCTIPLYVGSNLSKAGLPENIAFTLTQSDYSIHELTDTITKDKAEKMLRTGQEFIASEYFKTKFLADSVFKDLSMKLKEYMNLQSKQIGNFHS